MAAILNQPATMPASYLNHLTSEMTQLGSVATELDDWENLLLDPAALLESVSGEQEPSLEVSDYICFQNDDEEYPQSRPSVVAFPDVCGMNYAAEVDGTRPKNRSWSVLPVANGAGADAAACNGDGGGLKRKNEKVGAPAASGPCKKIVFRTRTAVDVLDDGYKWRKYGKKSVKNSPNPRNYYKCSYQGCGVRKIVERDNDDSSYVLTKYDGTHTHLSPSAAAGRYSMVGSSLNSVASPWQSRGGNWASSTLHFESGNKI